jgi:integrase
MTTGSGIMAYGYRQQYPVRRVVRDEKGNAVIDAKTGRPIMEPVIDAKTGKPKMRRAKWFRARYNTPTGVEYLKGQRFSTKEAAEEAARKAEKRIFQGLSATDSHAERTLTEHAADFHNRHRKRKPTEEYAKLAAGRLTSILNECGFVSLTDIQAEHAADAVKVFLDKLQDGTVQVATRRGQHRSVKSANEYLAIVKSFTRWLHSKGRIAADRLADMEKLERKDADIRHGRRDLSPDELGLLLDATLASRRVKYNLDGADRYHLYLTAASTGFRVSELASMTPESFDLDGDTPTATVQAGCTKNREQAVQPLPASVATALRGYLEAKPAGVAVWPAGCWPVHASIMIRRDLEAARTAWLSLSPNAAERAKRERSSFLSYRDASGRHADFHALRHTFITMVGKLGVSAKEHQELARHSTYALTGKYTHSKFYDCAAAVQGLPIQLSGGPSIEAGAVRATGTDGKGASNGIGDASTIGARIVARCAETENPCIRLRNAADGDNGLSPSKTPEKQPNSSGFAGFAMSKVGAQKERDTGVEPVSQPWEGWAQPIYQSRDTSKW